MKAQVPPDHDIYIPFSARIVSRIQEAPDIFSLNLEMPENQQTQHYQFKPGQFNMLYSFGVGEVAISTVSDPEHDPFYTHTIRRVGRVTHSLSLLQEGDFIGVRGPFGRGWPMERAKHKDVLIITGGIGCAPSVSIINYIMHRRQEFGRVMILQGVKHSDDLIFRERYQQWAKHSNTEVHLAADVSKPNWTGYTGYVTELLANINLDINNTICMMCGPEMMMQKAVRYLLSKQLSEDAIYLNFERNMECAVGHCGHCQFGGHFVCKDGPVFCYPDIKHLMGVKGF